MGERVYPAVIRSALGLFRLLDLRIDLQGAEHIPDSGGAVVAANHVSYLDFMFVGYAALPKARLVRFMAKQSVFDSRISGPLMRGMHHIPVDRSAGAAAYGRAVDALHDGELVGVFPEATISRAFVPRPFKTGAARMALDADVPIVPVVTWGGHRIWTTGRRPRLVRHVPVTIQVGTPIEPAAIGDAPAVTDALRARLGEMVDQAQRSYPDRPVDGDHWWLPAHLGGSAPDPQEAAVIEQRAVEARQRRRSGKR